MRLWKNRLLLNIFLLFMSLIIPISFSSCINDLNDESDIRVYNYDDDHSYRVELHLAIDDRLIDAFILDEYPDNDYANAFEDVDEGAYYISIFRDQGTQETDRTGVFTVEDDEDECYIIEDDGDIVDCF